MSCYFRHMKEIFGLLDIDINEKNKKDIDKAIHKVVGTEYKDCTSTWKKIKEIIKGEDTDKIDEFMSNIKKELNI